MSEKELMKLIKKKETETVELKPSLSQINEIVETVSAFSNTKGGKIFIGISNSGKLFGVDIGKDTIERLTNKIVSNTEPKVYPSISAEKIDKRNIIIIDIPKSTDTVLSTVRMSKNEYEKLILEKKRDYWDEQICEASLEDIDNEKLRWFLKEAKKQRNLRIPEDAPIKEVLMGLKLMKDGKLTNAAILLFGKPPGFIQSEVKCIRFSGNEPVKPYIDFQTLDGNVFDLIDRGEDFVLRNVKKAIWLIPEQVQREEKYEYPSDAIREAITNAIVHRDYESTSKVQVRVFDDYIEIWNPGRLPEGWTVEKLKQKHESVPRNPLLFKQLFWVKYVEDVGGGTLDMIKKCREWGIPEPEFEDTGTSLVVTFRKTLLTEELMESLGLNERQKKALAYMKEHKIITNKEYCEVCGVVKDTANRDINYLLGKKLIEKRGSGPKTYYVLTTVR